MTNERIEQRLKLHIANVALAAVGRKAGDLREAKDALIREVARICHDAVLSHSLAHGEASGLVTDRDRADEQKVVR